jgi:3-oxoacyl-[acyl-carrier protein] reductase
MLNKIVVTGASSEIGQAICKKIIKTGDIALLQCFKHVENCIQFQKLLGESCKVIAVDFNNPRELDDFCTMASDTDILINAAAFTRTDLLVNLDEDDFNRMININIIAPVKLCRAVIPGMVSKRKGSIINISSVSAQRGNRGQTFYGGTKGFIESFTRSLAMEYGPKGIRANCVAPGPINSGSLKELLSYAKEEVMQSIVSKRLGTPEDVAAAVAFLCNEDASFINGKCISVDGGFMRGI